MVAILTIILEDPDTTTLEVVIVSTKGRKYCIGCNSNECKFSSGPNGSQASGGVPYTTHTNHNTGNSTTSYKK